MNGRWRNRFQGAVQIPSWLAGAIFLATLGHCWAANAPLLWHWSNPLPHGNNISDVAFANGQYIEVCDQGQIYSSVDMVNWSVHDSHTDSALRAVTFSGSRLVVTGAAGTVLYADDLDAVQPGQLLDGPTSDWLEAVAASTSVVVAVGDNAVQRRINLWLEERIRPWSNGANGRIGPWSGLCGCA
jgi:hypothetical protein